MAMSAGMLSVTSTLQLTMDLSLRAMLKLPLAAGHSPAYVFGRILLCIRRHRTGSLFAIWNKDGSPLINSVPVHLATAHVTWAPAPSQAPSQPHPFRSALSINQTGLFDHLGIWFRRCKPRLACRRLFEVTAGGLEGFVLESCTPRTHTLLQVNRCRIFSEVQMEITWDVSEWHRLHRDAHSKRHEPAGSLPVRMWLPSRMLQCHGTTQNKHSSSYPAEVEGQKDAERDRLRFGSTSAAVLSVGTIGETWSQGAIGH